MKTLIQWPRAQYWDKPWNPVVGCYPISPACDNCYAHASCERFKCSFVPHLTTKQTPPKKGVVFCGNMTDLFGHWVDVPPMEFFFRTLSNFDATYLWLTKRPDEMYDQLHLTRYSGTLSFSEAFNNHYFGFTAENQGLFNRRAGNAVYNKPYWVHGWLSLEPLLGPINLRLGDIPRRLHLADWIVVGCESGPNRRPCKLEWIESIVDQALSRRIPVFVKQLDIDGECVKDISRFPKHLQIRQVPWEVK